MLGFTNNTLEAARKELSAARNARADHLRAIEALDVVIGKLSRVEKLLAQDEAAPDPDKSAGQPVTSSSKDAVGPVITGAAPIDPSTLALSPDQIVARAASIIRDAGRPQRALDIATQIAPGYDPDRDDRDFYNRVYSILKRAKSVFKKVDRGLWTLRSQGAADLDLGEGDLSESEDDALEADHEDVDEEMAREEMTGQ